MIWWYISRVIARDSKSGGDMFPSCLTVKDTLIVNQNSANTKSMSYSGDILSLARNVYNWFYVIMC